MPDDSFKPSPAIQAVSKARALIDLAAASQRTTARLIIDAAAARAAALELDPAADLPAIGTPEPEPAPEPAPQPPAKPKKK